MAKEWGVLHITKWIFLNFAIRCWKITKKDKTALNTSVEKLMEIKVE